MSSFAAWGLSILGIAVITTVAEMLLPQGRMRTVIRSVTATVAAIIIITPIPQIIKHGINFDFSASAVDTDDDYLDYIEGKKRDLVCSAAEAYLKEHGYSGIEVSVELDGFAVKSASAKIVDNIINENGGHINKSEIKTLLAEYFGIDKEAVMVYG